LKDPPERENRFQIHGGLLLTKKRVYRDKERKLRETGTRYKNRTENATLGPYLVEPPRDTGLKRKKPDQEK